MELNNDDLRKAQEEEKAKERRWKNKWPVNERAIADCFLREPGDVCLILRYHGNIELHVVVLPKTVGTMWKEWNHTNTFLPSSGFVYDKLKSLMDMTAQRASLEGSPSIQFEEAEWLTLYSTLLDMAENQNG